MSSPSVPAPSSLPDLVLMGRPGCHLCDLARDALTAVLAERSAQGRAVPAWCEANIDEDPELHARYRYTIPVLVLGDAELPLARDAAAIRRFVDEAVGRAPAAPASARTTI